LEQQALRIRTGTLNIFGGRSLLTFSIALALFDVRFTEAPDSRQWSVDIGPYGLQQANRKKNPDRFPETRVAMTKLSRAPSALLWFPGGTARYYL
jgi:hypothetical protein